MEPSMIDDETLAKAFKSLAHPRRARIFRLLASRPEVGHSLAGLQNALKIGDTPLVHHLREMERAGLLIRQRRGVQVAHILTPDLLLLAMDETKRLAHRATGLARRRAA